MENTSHQAQQQYIKMTQTPLRPLIVRLAVPTICSMLITTFYNMADTFFVARIGTSAAGAVGVVFSLMAIIQAIGFMCGMGAGSIASRRLGAQKNDEASQATSSAFFMALTLGLAVTVLGLTFLDPFMRLLGSTETILPYAREYARWVLFGAPVMTTSFVMNTNLRAEGKAFFAMVGIVTGGLLNVALDPLFIFVFDMGIAGAAVATVLSQCVSFCILLSHFVFHRSVLRISPARASRSLSFYGLIVRTGFPTLLRQGLASAASVALNVNASVYGDAALAAMAIVMRVMLFIGSILIGFGQGFQPVAGYNYGAKRYDRVIEAYKFCVKTGLVVLTVVAAAFFIGAPQVMSLFQNSDPRVTEIGTTAFRAHCATLVLLPLTVLTDMLFQVTGKYKLASFLSGARRGFFFIPLVFILPRFFGLLGIQIAQPVSDLFSVCFSVPMAQGYIRWMQEQMEKHDARKE
ncbi:MAG: MATE family efflux transporter [Pyramidobacter sp.]|nr:MATE family efflux transporter [Pyramidobacter sp.]